MQKVITINLNGNAYQLDEGGYDALLAYLDRAEAQLRNNPDKSEILGDLEQAIAEKCQRFLGPQKSVVTTAEIEQILTEMGPVEGAASDAGSGAASTASTPGASAAAPGGGRDRKAGDGPAPKRLYLVHEGAMIAGVCNGIAAYLNIDVTIVRIVFAGLTLLTKGFWILAYFVLAFIIPSATTSEERAAAQGLPFNAQEVIDRAKRNYSDFASKNWGRQWRRRRREMKHRIRSMGHDWWPRQAWGPVAPPQPAGYVARVAAGFMVPILSFVNAVIFALLLFAIASLVTTQQILGEVVPADMPLWVGVAGVAVAYTVIAWPLHAARRASYWTVAGPHYGAVAAWDNLMSLGFAVLLAWFAYHYVPEVREVIDQLPAVWDSLRSNRI